MLTTELKGYASLLEAQNESLLYKHRKTEGIFSTEQREKTSDTTENQVLRTCKSQNDQIKLQIEKLKTFSISCSKLGTQIKAVDGLQEIDRRRKEAFRFNSERGVGEIEKRD